MHGKKTGLILSLLIILTMNTIGCGQKHTELKVIMENNTSADLHIPADFTIKVTGETVYTFNDTTIPVGNILKENLEENLKKIERFSVNRHSGNQYLIGIDILKYEPRVEFSKKTTTIFQHPELWYEVIVCNIEIDKNGNQIIGEKVFGIPFIRRIHGQDDYSSVNYIPLVNTVYSLGKKAHTAATSFTAYRGIIEKAAKDISDAINKTFPK